MREILFRGKTPKGEWVYGNYCGAEYLTSDGIEHLIVEVPREGRSAQIIPETVGQYAELTDKNGKKVFDGDILKNEYEKNKYQYFKVYYCSRTHSWLVENKYGMLGKLYNVIGDIEIIGNIHDNPELLRTPQNDEVRE